MDIGLNDRLKRRKLDALRRGVHRVENGAALPFNVHLVGIGRAGSAVVVEALKSLQPSEYTMSALVIDADEVSLKAAQDAAEALPPGRAIVDIVALETGNAGDLKDTFHDYWNHLKLEYPLFPWTLDGEGWLPPNRSLRTPDGGLRRAYAKALYGKAYYHGERSVERALRRFSESVNQELAQSVVCVVFGMGGGTGSGIAVDLARHLTNVFLGRQALVVGLGIMPCEGDVSWHRSGSVYAALNEFDCLGDETKNNGVVKSCGELFRNPFTAGLLLIPQQHVWKATGSLAKTHQRVDAEIASLVTERGGGNLMESLRMLNWVAAPSTQHSAARTPWGAQWIHLFGFCDLDGGLVSPDPDFQTSLGIAETYHPEFIEVRMPSAEQNAAGAVVERLASNFCPDVPPAITGHGREGSAQFVLPSVRKADLNWFKASKDSYNQQDLDEKILDHSLLLDQGIVLSEPSDRMEKMAGANICGSGGWIAISMEALLAE
jgi:hypothetical protein